MNHSYLLIGTSFTKLISIIVRNGGISINNINRLLFLFQGSIWSSIFSMIEKIKFAKKLKYCSEVINPIIIVGHWRTGSTFLHQILSLDKQFVTPRVVQVSVPGSLLVSEPYFRSVMNRVMSKKRPMDNVALGPDEPQEDEYALLKIAKNTPLEKLVFKSKKENFSEVLLDMNKDSLSSKQSEKLKVFLKKIYYKNPGIVLLKNPFHSYRIEELKKTFPKARFIHIYRDPVNVIPSTVKMFNIIGKQNRLKGKWVNENLYTITKSFNHLWKCLKNQLYCLSKNDYIEIKYEELDSDPQKIIKTIYNHFNLEYTSDFDSKVQNFLFNVKNYKKNKFSLSAEEKDHIKKSCKDFLNHYY